MHGLALRVADLRSVALPDGDTKASVGASLMPEANAMVDGEGPPQSESRLFSTLLWLGAIGFVTALIGFSGSASPAWLLYLVPITIAALSHDVVGGIIASLLSAAALALAAPGVIASDKLPELVTGLVVFLGCGIVVGVQARKQRLHARLLEQASMLDPETAVAKSAHFYSRLNEEIRRADRYGHPLGLAFVQVDGFEEFVRLFGRYKASLMLRHLADVLRLSVRNTDVVGRVDVATFAIILLHGDAEYCRTASARIRGATMEAAYEGDALEPVTSCPTRVAYASYPNEASDQRGLTTLAHARLSEEPHENGPVEAS